jgi:hypothetical protein
MFVWGMFARPGHILSSWLGVFVSIFTMLLQFHVLALTILLSICAHPESISSRLPEWSPVEQWIDVLKSVPGYTYLPRLTSLLKAVCQQLFPIPFFGKNRFSETS